MVAHTRDELLEFFDEQIGFLERSNEAFDQGHLSEAKRLSVTLRVLFHHTADNPRGSSHALINLLDLEGKLTWVDTAGMPNPNNISTTPGLVQMGMDIGSGEARYRAPLGDRPPTQIRTKSLRLPRGSRIPLDEWWTEPVMKDSDETLFSRKDLAPQRRLLKYFL